MRLSVGLFTLSLHSRTGRAGGESKEEKLAEPVDICYPDPTLNSDFTLLLPWFLVSSNG